MASKKDKGGESKGQVAVNKKAYHNFELTEKIEAGISLVGSEVKSLREHNADLNGSYAKILGDECFLLGATIAIYEQAGDNNHDPTRKRKLLLHRREILKIRTKLEQRGYTLVPLRIYFNNRGIAKIELALACGKRQYDKRRTIAQRDMKEDMQRQMKKYRK